MHDFDLICGDYSTIASNDLVAVDRVSTEFIGEVYMLKPREYYNWYWFDHQRFNEGTLFVSYDSHPHGDAPCKHRHDNYVQAYGILTSSVVCPHTSAKNPQAAASAPPRESVELRIILFSPS